MEKVNLKIESHEDKTSKNGKDYTRFKTNQGWMSAFDTDVIKGLKECEGKFALVEMAVIKGTDGKEFKNIREYHGPGEAVFNEIDERPERIESGNKFASMYVSYAKDIFCELCKNADPEKISLSRIMETAIDLVKKARTAFE